MRFTPLVPGRLVAALVSLVLVGCSTAAGVTYLEKPDKALDLTGLRIVYLERETRVNSSDPRFDNELIKQSIADLGKVVVARLPAGLATLGIETASLTVPTDATARLPLDAQDWLRNEHPDWPVLMVVPAGGRIFCTPCTLQTDVVLDIRAAESFTTRWAVKLQQPKITPSVELGQGATYRHYADEMLRTLLADVRGPKSP